MTDIKLNEDWELTASASGDAPVVSGMDCYIQTLRIEALTQEGELFYDTGFGWSLMDFMHAQDDELTRTELEGRCLKKLAVHTEIQAASISVSQIWSDEQIQLLIRFKTVDGTDWELPISISRIKVVVTS